MTTADKLIITGIVVDRNHKDGVSAQGKKWDRYGFQVAGKDGKHWYTSFAADAWAALEKGKCFEVYYSEKENPQGGAPYRNLEWWKEVEMPEPTALEAQEAAKVATRQNDRQDSIDQRIAWNSAVNNAVHGLAARYFKSDLPFEEDQITEKAVMLYRIITAGPSQGMPQDDATVPVPGLGSPEPSQTPPGAGEPPKNPQTGWPRVVEEAAKIWNDNHKDNLITRRATTMYCHDNCNDKKVQDLGTEQALWLAKEIAEGRVAGYA